MKKGDSTNKHDCFDRISGSFNRKGTITSAGSALAGYIREKNIPAPVREILSKKKLEKRFGEVEQNNKQSKCSITGRSGDDKSTAYLWVDRYNSKTGNIDFLCEKISYSRVYENFRYSDLFGKILSLAPDMIFVLNSDMEIVYSNNVVKKLIKESNLAGKIIPESIMPGVGPFLKRLKTLSPGDTIKDYEIVSELGTTGKKYSIASAAVLKNIITQKNEYIIEIKDLTEMIRGYSDHVKSNIELINLNESLKRNSSQVFLQDKLASIGQLSAGIAHEINNPLSYLFSNIKTLCNYVSVLKNYVFLSRKLYMKHSDMPHLFEELKKFETENNLDFIFEDVNEISRESTGGIMKIQKIIDGLSSFSRKTQLQKQELYSINKAIEEMLVITNSEYKYDIDVKFGPDEIPEIFCIPEEINQALLNIFLNGLEACKRQEKEQKGAISIKTYRNNQYIAISMENSGPNIPDEIINRIFEPFFTTKKTGEGMGLGLAIAQDIIVNKHQGNLSVENTENGVRVIIELPIIEYDEGGE